MASKEYMEGQLAMAQLRYAQHKREYGALMVKLVEDKETIRNLNNTIQELGSMAIEGSVEQ